MRNLVSLLFDIGTAYLFFAFQLSVLALGIWVTWPFVSSIFVIVIPHVSYPQAFFLALFLHTVGKATSPKG